MCAEAVTGLSNLSPRGHRPALAASNHKICRLHSVGPSQARPGSTRSALIALAVVQASSDLLRSPMSALARLYGHQYPTLGCQHNGSGWSGCSWSALLEMLEARYRSNEQRIRGGDESPEVCRSVSCTRSPRDHLA